MINETGKAVPGKEGLVYFGAGVIKESEYKKYLQEQKDKEREAKREKKKLLDKLENISKKIKLEEIRISELAGLGGLSTEKVLEVIEKTERINERILKGEGLADVALSESISRESLNAFLKRYFKAKSFASYTKKLLDRHKEITTSWGIHVKKKREIRFFIRVPFESFKARLEGRADPIVSTEEKSYEDRWYAKAKPGQVFSEYIDIVGTERSIQPIKRIRIASHSFMTAHEWDVRNNPKLMDVSCKLAAKSEDKYLTAEGGIIISKKFALSQNVISKGVSHNLGIGDKILGIYGLKGIVSEIRKQSADIVINKNQIWDAKVPELGKNKVKMSRLCGAAVLNMQEDKSRKGNLKNGFIKVFYQPEHLIQRDIKEGSEPRTRFSPDLVPFLAHYLTSKQLSILQGENKKRFQDILYMLNLAFVNRNGYLTLVCKTTQPKEREGGELYPFNRIYWGKKEKDKTLGSKEVQRYFVYFEYKTKAGRTKEMRKGTIAVSEKAALEDVKSYLDPSFKILRVVRDANSFSYYPFVLENIWVPDWYIKENKRTEIKKEKGEVVGSEIKDDKFVRKIKEQPERLYLANVSLKFIYRYMFAEVEESLSYLTAFAKNGEPDTILLNKTDAEVRGIKEGDRVLLYRYPVVDKLNIQKMQVKFGTNPRSTVGINVESIRLMHGDFDGDALYLLKIPQVDEFADVFEVSFATYNEERKKILSEIKESDAIKLPKNSREIKLAQREAFYEAKISEGSWLPNKLAAHNKKMVTTPDGHIRTDTELIEESKRVHNNLNASGTKAETIGTATKWMWLSPAKIKESDIQCIASLEIIKDRADLKSETKYKESLATLIEIKEELETIRLKDGSLNIPWQTRAFLKIISRGTFKSDPSKFPVLNQLKGTPIIKANTAYAKFILALVGK